MQTCQGHKYNTCNSYHDRAIKKNQKRGEITLQIMENENKGKNACHSVECNQGCKALIATEFFLLY